MEAIAFLVGFVALAVLALRFGHDSRAGLRSPEQDLAAQGINWSNLTAERRNSPSPAGPGPYPTLTFIERAIARPGVLTASADADGLEVRARVLTADYWSDRVWTTGAVPEAALRVVLLQLEPTLTDAPVRVVERPLIEPEPVAPVRSPASQATETSLDGRQAGFDLAGSIAMA